MTKVVATTPQLADIARNVAGEDVEVETLLEGDVDPHDYEPRPSDAKALAEADVILRSGGEVDAWLGDLVDSAGGGGPGDRRRRRDRDGRRRPALVAEPGERRRGGRRS